MIIRKKTKEITIGNLKLGGNNKILIQSMTNTRTKDVKETISQIKQLELAGCDIIRVAVLDKQDAYAIKDIVSNINIPLVADIHFDYELALISIESGASKIRINPGNIGNIENIKKVVLKCKEKNIPIRIGVNTGSIDPDIYNKYGNDEVALVESAKKHIKILEDLEFYDIALSLKASSLELCIESYREAANTINYPLHLGVTHAGTEFSGTISSSIGLGTLLREGIGNTMRVSLSADPVKEVKVAKEILKDCNLYNESPTLIACPTCGRIQYDLIPIANEIEDFLQTIKAPITVAVMGCGVNGPNEARHADIGIAGGIKEGLLFKKGEIIKKVKQEDIVDVLKEEILKMVNA